MPKRILSWQSKFNRFLQTYLFASLHILMLHISLLNRNRWLYWKWTNVLRKNLGIFQNVKKIEIYFFITHLLPVFVNKDLLGLPLK